MVARSVAVADAPPVHCLPLLCSYPNFVVPHSHSHLHLNLDFGRSDVRWHSWWPHIRVVGLESDMNRSLLESLLLDLCGSILSSPQSRFQLKQKNKTNTFTYIFDSECKTESGKSRSNGYFSSIHAYSQMVFNMHNFTGGKIGRRCRRHKYIHGIRLLLLRKTAACAHLGDGIPFDFMLWTVFIRKKLDFLQPREKWWEKTNQLGIAHRRLLALRKFENGIKWQQQPGAVFN